MVLIIFSNELTEKISFSKFSIDFLATQTKTQTQIPQKLKTQTQL